MLPRTPDRPSNLAPRLVTETAGQWYKQTAQFLFLGGNIYDNADLSLKITPHVRLMRACLKRFGPVLYGRTTAPLSLSVRMLKADVIETLL